MLMINNSGWLKNTVVIRLPYDWYMQHYVRFGDNRDFFILRIFFLIYVVRSVLLQQLFGGLQKNLDKDGYQRKTAPMLHLQNC